MSKHHWLTAAIAGAGLAALAALALGLAGVTWVDRHVGVDITNGMIFLGLGMIAIAGLITNAPSTDKARQMVEPRASAAE
ncbi:MAG TPA: hypothetical protein VFN88_07635 [Caulobacteraceae bacterium]|nr:hypothetical protein [Caulobacteraceae bacterium]